jgi:hypothetical protein
MNGSWTTKGFWMLLGLSAGMLLSSLTQPPRLGASATSPSVEGTLLATGDSNSPSVELLWALDDKGILTAMLFGQQGRLLAAPSLDVKKHIKVRGGKKPRFAMVTGKYKIGAQIVDALYVTEASTNTLLVVNPSADGSLQPIYLGPINQSAQP